jgi:hypothetical protein
VIVDRKEEAPRLPRREREACRAVLLVLVKELAESAL